MTRTKAILAKFCVSLLTCVCVFVGQENSGCVYAAPGTCDAQVQTVSGRSQGPPESSTQT